MNNSDEPQGGGGRPDSWRSFAFAKARLLGVWRELIRVNASDRPWEMPLAAALSSGLPLLVGAYFGRMDYGLMSSLGGMVFLSLPNSSLQHRMMMLLAASFGLPSCWWR
jgi:hypothetical protein